MKWFKPEDKLPEEGRYVLIHVPDRPWSDSEDRFGVFYQVAKLKMGLTLKQRDNLPEWSARKLIVYGCDEHANNKRGYNWVSFGAMSYFGQEVKHWAYINYVDFGDELYE